MAKAKKFGAFGGVFTPSILTLLGVIMYLRLPWIVGQVGLLSTLGIILVAHIISGSTGLSVASIATDKKVETGGTYYIISRSLGLPIGGTLGWALFVGLSFSVSLYLIGFAEVFLGYFGFEVNLTTIRIAGSIILLLVTILTFISTSLAIKTQYIILTIMALSLLSVFFGKHDFPPVVSPMGAVPSPLSWIALFAIFFPAVTGFEAGVSMSGDLKDARKDIPLGTIAAILVGLTVYVGLSVFLSFTVSNDLLANDTNVLFKISWIPQLVIAGILGATFSSALGSIMGAPRIMQAVAKDGIAPFFFSKGVGASNEPRNALLLTFIIAQTGILIGDLNAIARIVTIFFIITYGFLNITYTVESWASSDFRPSFKIPRFVSIIGALACIIVMIQLDIMALGIATVVLLALFFFLKNKELKLQSGDTLSSLWLSLVKTGLLKLAKSKIDTRNWRPNVILFSGASGNRPHLIELGKAVVGKLGIFTNFELIEDAADDLIFDKTARVSVETISNHDVITRKHSCSNVYEGMAMISRIYGFSGFEPNTILMGWSKNTNSPEKWTNLLLTLNKLDYNLAFLNYDKNAGFGKYKKIDFWWSGEGRNLSLALHLIRFITVTPQWRYAEIRILAINPNPKNTDRYYAVLGQAIDNYRIRATVKVIVNIDKTANNELVKLESQDTDLTIAGLSKFGQETINHTVEEVNDLVLHLKSCLLIHASSNFDVIAALNPNSERDSISESNTAETSPIVSVLTNLQQSENSIVNATILNVATLLDKQSAHFTGTVLDAIPESRGHFLDQLERLTSKIINRLEQANAYTNEHEKQFEQFGILNDFSYQAQREISNFKEIVLKEEVEILQNGVLQLIASAGNAVYNIPKSIRLKFGKNDYAKLKAIGLLGKIKRTYKMGWTHLTGKEIGVNIQLQGAASYFLYYKNLEFIRRFYDAYITQSLEAFSGIKELLHHNALAIEKCNSNNLTVNDIAVEKEKICELVLKLRAQNHTFFQNQRQEMLEELSSNLTLFSQTIENPQANLLSRKFKSLSKQTSALKNSITEFPDLWLHFMVNHINKTYLDFIFYSLKNKLNTKIAKLLVEIKYSIDTNILKNLKVFGSNVQAMIDKNEGVFSQKDVFSNNLISVPLFEDNFYRLLKAIQTKVEKLPKELTVNGDELLENISYERLENVSEFGIELNKIADYHISNELGNEVRKQLIQLQQQLTITVSTIKNLIRMANFHLENKDLIISQTIDKSQKLKNVLLEELLGSIKSEEAKLNLIYQQISQHLKIGLKNAFEPLSAAIILKSADSLKKEIRTLQQHRLVERFKYYKKSMSQFFVKQMVHLLYRQSKILLWSKRMEQARAKEALFPGEPLTILLAQIAPEKSVMLNLPFYYSNLFSGSLTIGDNFWVGMKMEIEKGSRAIKLFSNDTSGLLIITGERSSGKSSLSKFLANRHFEKSNIFNLSAPSECTSDLVLFEQLLLNTLGGDANLAYTLEMLPARSVIIINDMELWWERKPMGTQVIEKIILLMQQYSHKILFILNVNQFALKIINELTAINTHAIEIVFCQPFDSQELKNMILMRHQAGGMSFSMDKKHEKSMSDWDYARIFNQIFNLADGNPGLAIHLWLAGIHKIEGNTLYMHNPFGVQIELNEPLSQEDIFYLLQFVLHRRFSLKSLSQVLQSDIAFTETKIRSLLQRGYLIEKLPEVYCLNPALEIHLVKKLKSLEIL
ncbi:MAG: hypothetical protein AUK44_08515 [Porphyromonadaceae bacterium CG2_30_38_12]|nr:MAG: hypothetical protein AUK44_08515 [Porphyromonadaceae bacterium CG2_30_38_12]